MHGAQRRKARVATGLSSLLDVHQRLSGMDGIHGTGIHASAAVDAGIGIDDALVALLADGVDRTGILTCCAVGAIVGNGVSHGSSSFKNCFPCGKRYQSNIPIF
jgi:hypothetical protein